MLELVAYAIGGSMWWILSTSVLFPFVLMLKISKTFRDAWFSFFFMKILGPMFNHISVPLRKEIFQLLSEELNKKEKKSSYEVLEIGIGGGANLEFYPENCILTALDMNQSFETYFNENKKKYPQITFKKMIHAMAENMTEVSDETMDIIICTYVLCSVDEIKSALSEVKRVLKPGGVFLFLEHQMYHPEKFTLNHALQKIVAPLWRTYFDGCNIDRDIRKEIDSHFSDINIKEKYPRNLPLYVRPQMYGVAIK